MGRILTIACGLRLRLLLLTGLLVVLGVAPAIGASAGGHARPARTSPTATAAVTAPLCSATHWVGSWGDSPSDASVGLDASLKEVTLGSDQSFRMIITPHLAGTVIRLHLSNRFGAQPVTFTTVGIGDRQSGAALVPGSERTVTFDGGSASVTVPAGADVVSDPIDFTVAPFADLAVSLYVTSGPDPTEHFTGRQTSYLTMPVAGDHVSDQSGSAFTQSTTARYYVTGLDVEASQRVGAVVAFGDSITDGFQGPADHYPETQSTLNLNDRYPDFLQRRLDAAGIPLSVINAGISGNRLLSNAFSSHFGLSGLTRFTEDALDVPGVTDVILLEGINDIGDGSGVTAQQMISGYEQVIGLAHTAGVKIQLGTLTPSGGYSQASYSDAAADSVRTAVNAWIRSQHLSDGYVDFDAAVRDPADPADLAPEDNGGDGLHLDPAGYQAMADAVGLGQLVRATCQTSTTSRTSTKITSRHNRPHRPRPAT